jgi:hypothetical protein
MQCVPYLWYEHHVIVYYHLKTKVLMKKGAKPTNWEKLSDEKILQMRVRDLNLKIEGSPIEPLVSRLYNELDAKDISFHPPCYLADEWLCPDRIPIIGIPFFLAHPRLKRIERKMMVEVEGGTERAFMKLIRHECGHALNYAYKLYSKTRWRQLFGSFTAKYSDSYYCQPYSRRFVIHLRGNYAQSHPDEDFAETFAVWLTPSGRWQEKYRNWPAVKKLKYIDRLMPKINSSKPLITASGNLPWSASRMTSTLSAYYDRKRKALGTGFYGFYDDSLKEIFKSKQSDTMAQKASTFLRLNRRTLVDHVAQWTGHPKYHIYQLFNILIARCEALRLHVGNDQTDELIGLAVLLTSIAGNIFKTRRKNRR